MGPFECTAPRGKETGRHEIQRPSYVWQSQPWGGGPLLPPDNSLGLIFNLSSIVELAADALTKLHEPSAHFFVAPCNLPRVGFSL